MPSASNSSYCFGAKCRTIRSIGIKAMMATALLAITVVGRASVDEVARWNQIATDVTTAANTNPLAESSYLCDHARCNSRCRKCH